MVTTARIKVPIFRTAIEIVYEPNGWDYIKRRFDCEIPEIHKNELDGLAYQYESPEEGTLFVVAFNKIPKKAVMIHEAVHLTNMICLYKGIRLDPFNDETQAYLTEWIYNKINKFFKNQKALKLRNHENK